MGSSESKPTDETVDELEANRMKENRQLYKIVDMHGSGTLFRLIRECKRMNNYALADDYIKETITPYLWNGGKGKIVPITDLIKIRNQERNAKLSAIARKKSKGKSGPNILDELDQEGANVGDLKKALKLLDGGGKKGKSESRYREIVWKLEDRGNMGETLLCVCLLQGSPLHNEIATKLIDCFPKLINDVCISEEYYGLSPLHLAIINHDAQMVMKLLKRGADVNQRCLGAFFCADDQKASRTDSMEHEEVELSVKTNYTGSMYFGEYPLSFAVCMDQPDMFRLLVAHKVNLNAKDSNGNTVLHLCVIHEKENMLALCLEAGANPKISNKQNLTPLTLAAKLAKKKMFDFLLKIESEQVWTYGGSNCIAYPLTKIDTIDERTGHMNEDSALSLIVYGETREHLDLMDGLIENILDEKWKSFARRLWLQSGFFFVVYYVFFFSAYLLRPMSMTTTHLTHGLIDPYGKVMQSSNLSYLVTSNYTWKPADTQCHLLDYSKLPVDWGWTRLGCEIVVLLIVLIHMIIDAKDIQRTGIKKWFSRMKVFPSKLMYKFSNFLIIFIVPIRLSCHLSDVSLFFDNLLVLISVVLVTCHFLYFCRAIPFVGPFVLMVYTIITRDLTRFLVIYGIFLIGFSQSFYVIFKSCDRAARALNETSVKSEFSNILDSPIEAFIRAFIMTLGEFSSLYKEMSSCDVEFMRNLGKIVFVFFEAFVSILQFNLLIAMMTRTYEQIFLTRKEWKRQWAQVILMLEMSLSPHTRLLHLLKYSRPTGTNKKTRSYVVIKKTAVNESSERADQEMRAERDAKRREEKRALMRKKFREQELKEAATAILLEDGLRVPRTPVSRTPKRMLRQSTIDGRSPF